MRTATLLTVASFLPHSAADRLAERLGAAGIEPRVFYTLLGQRAETDRIVEEASSARLSVIAGMPEQMASPVSAGEFDRSLAKLGLTAEFVGWVRENPQEPPRVPVAFLRGARPPVIEPAPPSFRVGAIITAYNEADVIGDTIRHLAANGVHVYLIDNWSTDATLHEALAIEGVEWLGHEHFPEDGPSEIFEWTRLLERVEALASNLDVDWVMSNDADEFRYSPWTGVNLRDAFFHVESQGFNAVNHSYLNFELTEDSLDARSAIEGLRWFRPERSDLSRVTSWHHEPGRIEEIAWSGNHKIRFAGRAVFPYNFLCKHYPIRSLDQGTRKIFQDRLPRYSVSERLKGWHSHYDKLSPQKLIKPTDGLFKFDETFDEHYVIERLTGVGFDPLPARLTPKLRVARILRTLGVLDRALSLRWRWSGRAAK